MIRKAAVVLMASFAIANFAHAEPVHKASGTVTRVDPARGSITIAHAPVPSMKWPAMRMAFKVDDKAILDKLAKDQKIDFEFVQRGRDYVVTSVK